MEELHSEFTANFFTPKRYSVPKGEAPGICFDSTCIYAFDHVKQEKVVILKLRICDIGTGRVGCWNVENLYLGLTLNNDCIMPMRHIYSPETSAKELQHVYVVYPEMDADLTQVVGPHRQKLGLAHISYLIYQLLYGLNHFHKHGIVLQWLHTGSLGVNEDCSLLIKKPTLPSNPVHSLFDMFHADPLTLYNMFDSNYPLTYSAPELLMGLSWKDPQMDMWSVGMILTYLILNKQIYNAGGCPASHLKAMFQLVGYPEPDETPMMFNINGLDWVNVPDFGGFDSLFADSVFKLDHSEEEYKKLTPDVARDLLWQMLRPNPRDRISVEQAMMHPFFAPFFEAVDLEESSRLSCMFDMPYYNQLMETCHRNRLRDVDLKGILYKLICDRRFRRPLCVHRLEDSCLHVAATKLPVEVIFHAPPLLRQKIEYYQQNLTSV